MSSRDLRATADFFVSSGLAKLGYTYVSTDDGWMAGRDAEGRLVPNDVNFPEGIPALVAYINSKGLKVGLYSAASSVVCSGRVGSLYHEAIDAQTYAAWGVSYAKHDNCGEYGLGDARFVAFADAVNATGAQIVISTEPFSLQPNPAHREFAHMWRTTNDINANFGTILDRAGKEVTLARAAFAFVRQSRAPTFLRARSPFFLFCRHQRQMGEPGWPWQLERPW